MLTTDQSTFFKKLLGERCLQDLESLSIYGHDETEDKTVLSQAILLPETVEEVSKIMKFCFENEIKVTPSG
ncbi:MAG: FAD-binding oxidoreductase, partial [Bacteroidetes bacterium]|nr:FAD-binding oxidoreductase [Bacteroidota bacterium]